LLGDQLIEEQLADRYKSTIKGMSCCGREEP